MVGGTIELGLVAVTPIERVTRGLSRLSAEERLLR